MKTKHVQRELKRLGIRNYAGTLWCNENISFYIPEKEDMDSLLFVDISKKLEDEGIIDHSEFFHRCFKSRKEVVLEWTFTSGNLSLNLILAIIFAIGACQVGAGFNDSSTQLTLIFLISLSMLNFYAHLKDNLE